MKICKNCKFSVIQKINDTAFKEGYWKMYCQITRSWIYKSEDLDIIKCSCYKPKYDECK